MTVLVRKPGWWRAACLARGVCVAAALMAFGAAGAAQQRPAAATTAAAVLARIDSLAGARDSAGARRLADSVLADTDPSAAVYPEALYRRGILAGTSAGRTDLARLIVDYPLSDRTGDALLVFARADLAAGARASAVSRLERIVRDFAGTSAGPDAAVELARMQMAQGNIQEACMAFDSALAYIPESDVERHRRVSYDARPCERYREAVADSVAAAAASRTAPAGADSDTAKPVGDAWTVQVAAYAARTDASRFVSRIELLGFAARVWGNGPYRVRVGRYATIAKANATAAKLRAAKFTAIVVKAEQP